MGRIYMTKQKTSKKRPLLVLAVILAALVVACGVLLAVWSMDPYDHKILSGVSIAGLDVGGMTKTEAQAALEQELSEVLNQDLTVVLPEETLSLSQADTQVTANVRDAVDAAYQYGRGDMADSALPASYEIGLTPYLEFSENAIRSTLEAYADAYDTTLSQPSYHLEGDMPALSTDAFQQDAPCQTLVLTKGIPTRKLDVDAVYDQILAVYDSAVTAAREGQYRVESDVPPEAVPEALVLGDIQMEFFVAAVNDSLNMETYAFVPGSYGYCFSLEEAKQLLSQADYGETVRVSMQYVEPEILGDEVYFRDVLGSCETKHGTNENRNTNLRLVCEILNGLILQPGEEFSFNGVIGERTAERGFKPAPAYSGTRLIDSVGGGVCQTSTTLNNCVLLADLEVLDRACHGAMVSYVPIGLDAAVNWGTTDFAFRNNFNFPIKIEAETTEDYVKMKILGTDEKDYYVVMTSGYDDSNPSCTYAVSYKYKYSKETGEQISREREAFSSYYHYD